MSRLATDITGNPFPGLRPFQEDEDYLFFGREGQTAELLKLLRESRFLAVVGTSGSGKSSLIRAGLVPALHRGAMVGAGSNWEVVFTRPGGAPLENLARSLEQSDLYEPDADLLPRLLTCINRSRVGLVDAVKQAGIGEGTNFLLIVDQFEEVFRFRSRDEESLLASAHFVASLLEATAQSDVNIYVMLTMRSDYLGDCALFPGLAEAVNRGEYLIPRLNREELQSAIARPIQVAGGRIANRLVQKLLNKVSDNQDQLPILQHALMRTWSFWERGHSADEPIDLRHFESAGEIEFAISKHAGEIMATLSEGNQVIAEKMFKALTELGSDRREIRRPTRFDQLQKIVGCSEESLLRVIEAFRDKGCAFLTPTQGMTIYPDTVIDIAHESLMRVWDRLKEWVQQEYQSARVYKRLAETAVLHSEGKSGLYRDPDLQIALTWRDQNPTNDAWGARYHEAFALALDFLDRSQSEQQRESQAKEVARERELQQARALAELEKRRADELIAEAKRTRIVNIVLAGLTIAALVLGVVSFRSYRRAEDLYRDQKRTSSLLELKTSELEASNTIANRNKEIAERQSKLAIDTTDHFIDELIDRIDSGTDPEILRQRLLKYLGGKVSELRVSDETSDLGNLSVVAAELGFARSLVRLDSSGKGPFREKQVNESGVEETDEDARADNPSNQENTDDLNSRTREIVRKAEKVIAYTRSKASSGANTLWRELLRTEGLLAEVYRELGQFEDAERVHRDVISYVEKLISDPGRNATENAIAQNSRMNSLMRLAQIASSRRQYKQAMGLYQQAISLGEAVVQINASLDHEIYEESLALLAEAFHGVAVSGSRFLSATQLADYFEKSDATILSIQSGQFSSHLRSVQANTLGELAGLYAGVNPTKSEEYRKRAEEILDLGSKKWVNTEELKARSQEAWIWIDRGDDLWEKPESWDTRMQHYKKAFDLLLTNAQRDPNSRRTKRDLSTAHERIGLAYLEKPPSPTSEDIESARIAFEKMLEMKKELADNKEDLQAQLHLAFAYSHFGKIEKQFGQISKAIPFYDKQRDILEPLFQRYPEEFSIARSLISLYWKLSEVYQKQGKFSESLDCLYRAGAILEQIERIEVGPSIAPEFAQMQSINRMKTLDLEAMCSVEKPASELMDFDPRRRELAFDARWKSYLESMDIASAINLLQPLEQASQLRQGDYRSLVKGYLAIAQIASRSIVDGRSVGSENTTDESSKLFEQYQDKAIRAAKEALANGALSLLNLRLGVDYEPIRRDARWEEINKPNADYRSFAESILKAGGVVGVVDESNQEKTINPGQDLPDQIYEIIEVKLSGSPAIEDQIMRQFRSLRGLQSLMIEAIPGLTNEQLQYLAGCRSLKRVGLGGNLQIDEKGLVHLAELPELTTLFLGGTRFTSEMAEAVSRLDSVFLLDLNTTLISDESVKPLAKMKSLKDLCLTNNAISDKGVEYLQGLDLYILRLSETDVTDKCLDSLVGMKSLFALNLDVCNITDAGVRKLLKLRSLQAIGLESTHVSYESLCELANLNFLESLHVSFCGLSDEEAAKLRKTLPFCKNINTTDRLFGAYTTARRMKPPPTNQ
jgi:tetratricopeptide (TPR) repeat protein